MILIYIIITISINVLKIVNGFSLSVTKENKLHVRNILYENTSQDGKRDRACDVYYENIQNVDKGFYGYKIEKIVSLLDSSEEFLHFFRCINSSISDEIYVDLPKNEIENNIYNWDQVFCFEKSNKCYKFSRRKGFTNKNIQYYFPGTIVGGLFACSMSDTFAGDYSENVNNKNKNLIDSEDDILTVSFDKDKVYPLRPVISEPIELSWIDLSDETDPKYRIPLFSTPRNFHNDEVFKKYKHWEKLVDVNELYNSKTKDTIKLGEAIDEYKSLLNYDFTDHLINNNINNNNKNDNTDNINEENNKIKNNNKFIKGGYKDINKDCKINIQEKLKKIFNGKSDDLENQNQNQTLMFIDEIDEIDKEFEKLKSNEIKNNLDLINEDYEDDDNIDDDDDDDFETFLSSNIYNENEKKNKKQKSKKNKDNQDSLYDAKISDEIEYEELYKAFKDKLSDKAYLNNYAKSKEYNDDENEYEEDVEDDDYIENNVDHDPDDIDDIDLEEDEDD